MRGADSYNESLFSTVRLEEFVPQTHPLRPIRTWMNEALSKMDGKFSAMYEADIKGGRPSIAPEKLMRAMLLQVLYSIRSERQLVEQISYNLLFQWFVGLSIEDAVWNHSANAVILTGYIEIPWHQTGKSRNMRTMRTLGPFGSVSAGLIRTAVEVKHGGCPKLLHSAVALNDLPEGTALRSLEFSSSSTLYPNCGGRINAERRSHCLRSPPGGRRCFGKLACVVIGRTPNKKRFLPFARRIV